MRTVERLRSASAKLSPLQTGFLIFAISFLLRIGFIWHFQTYRGLDRTELERTAISLATTGVYGNPYAVTTGSTGHVAPGYTLILAGLFRLFGTGIPAEIIKQIFSSAVVSLLYALLPSAARWLHVDGRAGVIAGLFSALYPARPLVEIKGDWEAPYTALALLLVSALTVKLWTRCEVTIRRALRYGLAWGISLLFVPALLPMPAAFVVTGPFFCRGAGLKKWLVFAAVAAGVVATCLAPWVIRNQHALGHPVVTRTNLGIELNISNNDDATPDQRVNYLNGLFAKYHPLLSKTEAMKVRQLGEVAYNQQVGDEAKQWMRANPARFVELCLGRVRCYWFYYDPTSPIKTIVLATTVLLGLGGFVQVFRRDRIGGTVIGFILLLYPLPNYLVHVGLRQEYPIHWLLTILAAAVVVSWFGATGEPAHSKAAAMRATGSRLRKAA